MKATPSAVITVAFLAACVMLQSCKSSKSATASVSYVVSENPVYSVDIKPIVDASCGNKCHSTTRNADGIDLSNYEGVKRAVSERLLLKAIKHEDGVKAMPRYAAKLDAAKIEAIEKWISQGMAQ